MKVLKLKDASLTQENSVFHDKDSGRDIPYFSYTLKIDGKDYFISLKHPRSKFYLEDIFSAISNSNL
ncbi:MAG: hypothetical protein LBT30_04990 [Clostridiales bacterium]|jgi:hypothetical protein|nr:hypothetical protein [Clostridiales bacterium]